MESYFQKFTRIVNNWLGKRVDVDGVYGAQCVDWARQYTNEAGRPIINRGNAIELWNKGLGGNWKKVEYKPGLKPSAGDVVLFNFKPYGHIAIADNSSDGASVGVIEQNRTATGTGLGKDAISKGRYSYGVVLGWFTY